MHLESYKDHERHLPSTGKFIIGQFDETAMIVYQAFNDEIADYAIAHQRFGGSGYDFGRTTWLKPSFLWMMFYSGWARKENQENVLAIRVQLPGFEELLKRAVLIRNDEEEPGAEVRLRWVSYHDLFGNKTDRMAAKIGLRGEMLRRYNEEWILSIENITDYVREQQERVLGERLDDLQLPHERAFTPEDLRLLNRLQATTISL